MFLGDTGPVSTQASAQHLLRRIAARAGLGVWRHRGGVLLSAVVSVALGGYVALTWTGSIPTSFASGSSAPNSDCADTAIAAIADSSPTAMQRAYQCMTPSFQQRVNEQTFAQQLQSQNLTNVKKLTRVGDYAAPAGGTMVYYAIDAGGKSVGYIVYVGTDGKVARIE
jgi:hypothetical protein